MDAQFIFVPENWVNKLILTKLLTLSISLANELKLKQHLEVKENESFEEKIDRCFRENLPI
jgi:hypothetical protein